MILLITSFIAGMFTVLAPCIVAFLPIILARGSESRQRSPVLVIAGLAGSIIIFSLLLKSTTVLLGVPDMVWSTISGVIILLFGVVTLFPSLWETVAIKFGFALEAQKGLASASAKKGKWADILLGASLGPVFSACSPTYALIVATILPADPLVGLVYLLAYVAGLCTLLGLIAIFGRSLISKLGWSMKPGGIFHKVLGVFLILLGIGIATGIEKEILSFAISQGWFDWQLNLEQSLVSQ